MKQKLFACFFRMCFTLMVLASSVFVPGHAAIITMSPSSSNIQVGEQATLSINLNNFADLYAYQINLVFNADFLHIDSVENSTLFPSGSVGFFPGVIDNDLGTLSSVYDSLSGPVAGVDVGGPIVLITFTGVGAGSSSIGLENVILLDSSLSTIDLLDVSGAQVNVTSTIPVPEPATYALLGLGLLGVGVLRRSATTLR